MGWMGKRGALTSLLWKVTHLGLLFGVCLCLLADSLPVFLMSCCRVVSLSERQAHKSPHDSHNSFRIIQMTCYESWKYDWMGRTFI